MPVAKSSGSGKTFTPCPAGMFQAVCVDVVDHGMVETEWGTKHKTTLRWQVDENMEDGTPYLVQKRYTLSLHEKANLRHDLESWRGRAFTEDEANSGFELDDVIGANCQLVVIHRQDSQGKVWANVQTIAPLGKGQTKMEPRGYVMERDRKTDTPDTPSSPFSWPPVYDDDVPDLDGQTDEPPAFDDSDIPF